MMEDIGLIAPIHPGQIPKEMRFGMDDLIRRISAKAVIEGRGHQLLHYIYMAGLYHGAALTVPVRYLALNDRQSGMAASPEPSEWGDPDA